MCSVPSALLHVHRLAQCSSKQVVRWHAGLLASWIQAALKPDNSCGGRCRGHVTAVYADSRRAVKLVQLGLFIVADFYFRDRSRNFFGHEGPANLLDCSAAMWTPWKIEHFDLHCGLRSLFWAELSRSGQRSRCPRSCRSHLRSASWRSCSMCFSSSTLVRTSSSFRRSLSRTGAQGRPLVRRDTSSRICGRENPNVCARRRKRTTATLSGE